MKKAEQNSIHQIVNYLDRNPGLTENEIFEEVFGYYRNSSHGSNKKYAEMLRRGMAKGLVYRSKIKKNHSQFIYFSGKQILEKVAELNKILMGSEMKVGLLVFRDWEKDWRNVGS
jgi:hydroxymethylpyrimidine pyrophosphatase-like HAD family hydrolase